MEEYSLVDNIFSSRTVEESIRDLFSRDGEVFMVAGYFHPSGYYQLNDSIEDFLNRNEDNEVTIIVGTEPNQFAATIATDLWEMDNEYPGTVNLLKYDDTFVHTKHYVRANEQQAIILGSANFTSAGFGKNLELVSYYETTDDNDEIAHQHLRWFELLIEECSPVNEDDLERYKEKRIDVEALDDYEILAELDLDINDLRNLLADPESLINYRSNLLSRYLEVEDTTRSTIAVKSRIEKLPHQIIAGSKAYKNLSYNGFYLLADEVGLGKTYEAGLALKQLKFAGKVDRTLILCNSSAMRDWEEAMEKFYENPTLITSSNKYEWKSAGFSERDIWRKDELMICTPEMFRQAAIDENTLDEDWDLLIVDEAHVVKNDNSIIHNTIKDFDVPYKLFLTATPVQNHEKEFYNLFDAMEENFLGTSYDSYRAQGERYLRDLLQGDEESFLTRFLRDELPYMEIPPREVHDRFVDLSPEEQAINTAFLDFLANLVEENEQSAAHLVATTYQKIAASSWYALEGSLKKLRAKHEETTDMELQISDFQEAIDDEGQTQLVDDDDGSLEVDMGLLEKVIDKLETRPPETKLRETVDAITEILEHEDRIVIFSQYRRNITDPNRLKYNITGLNLLEALIEELDDVPVYTYHGGMNTSERYSTRENFEETGGVFLATEAGAESINLQHCNILFNFDIPWNPARIEQRIGRIQRLGQKDEVTIFNLVLRNTLDESIYEKVIKKHQLLQRRFGSSEEVTEHEALEAVESGSIREIESTSQIFIKALRERRSGEEIHEYFELQLDERDDELNELQQRMEENLEDFDTRIKALLTGEDQDTDQAREDIQELSNNYKQLLREYLTLLRFTEGIEAEIEDNEVVLQGDRNLLGDTRVRAALDGETSLYQDIPLLTPSSTPLENLLEETTMDFCYTQVDDGSGFVFDFLITIDSPLNTIERVERVKTNSQTHFVTNKYLSDANRTDEGSVSIDEFLKALQIGYDKITEEANTIVEEELDSLDSFITSEVSRLRKRQTEEIQDRIKNEIRDPIQLQKDQVSSIEEKLKDGRATGMELEQARKELRSRQSQRPQKEQQIREEITEKYEKKIKQVREQKEDFTVGVEIISAANLAGRD